jgi:hypothetical protein
MIVCGKFEEDFLGFPPTLTIIEIASSKTRLKDRNVKFKLYESNGVKFYLIADPDKKTVEKFSMIRRGCSNIIFLRRKCYPRRLSGEIILLRSCIEMSP